jgi:ribosomal protein L32E
VKLVNGCGFFKETLHAKRKEKDKRPNQSRAWITKWKRKIQLWIKPLGIRGRIRRKEQQKNQVTKL